MIIVILSEWYSEKMGYAENYLPPALGELGHQVHLVTTDLQVYATSSDYDAVYKQHLGPRQVDTGVTQERFFTLHRNPHEIRDGILIGGLQETLRSINPDIIYCFEILTPIALQAVEYKRSARCRIFCESRRHLSVYPPPRTLLERVKNLSVKLKGWQLARHVEKFYPVAPDVLRMITLYCGIPRRKCKLASLAVNTEIFRPNTDPSGKQELRRSLGYNPEAIVCLYTGRFTPSKGPEILADAIRWLNVNGHTEFKGLFVGQGDEIMQREIGATPGCQIHPFVDSKQLPLFYQSFDIGVWPLQESTSQLDAAACGMPIIINESVEDIGRIEGNGLSYEDRDPVSLARQILKLKSQDLRRELGRSGSRKVAERYSWKAVAMDRENDFVAN
jgi:glycosyltransferase involved in cell wall biosynthesis